MSGGDFSSPPRRWMALVGLAAFFAAALILYFLLAHRQSPRQRAEAVQSQTRQEQQYAPEAAEPPNAFYQRRAGGEILPWGESIGAREPVVLEVQLPDPRAAGRARFEWGSGGAAEVPLAAGRARATVQPNQNGPLVWQVRIDEGPSVPPATYARPRAEGESDFIVTPDDWSLSGLAQADGDDHPLGDDRTTSNGIRLHAAWSGTPLDLGADSALGFEVELKRSGQIFDAGDRKPDEPDPDNPGSGVVAAQPPPGDYHWRARLTEGPAHGPWVEFEPERAVAFTVAAPPPDAAAAPAEAPSSDADGPGGHGGEGRSNLSQAGGGNREPSPSQLMAPPTLFQMLGWRLWVFLGLVAAAGAANLARHWRRRKPKA